MSKELQVGAATDGQVAQQSQNLENLVASTGSFLAVAQGWYTTSNSDTAKSNSNDLVWAQISNYVLAFKNGLDAAQYGHDASEEGLGLVDQLKHAREEGKSADDSEVIECLVKMKEFARLGEERAKGALEGFRSVRRGINRAIAEIKSGSGTSQRYQEPSSNEYPEKEISVLEKDLDPILGQSITVLDGYASWWNEIDMETSSQATRIARLADKYGILDAMSVTSKWRKLRDSYSDYTDKMHGLEDAYPVIFGIQRDIASYQQSNTPDEELPGPVVGPELLADVGPATVTPSNAEKGNERQDETPLSPSKESNTRTGSLSDPSGVGLGPEEAGCFKKHFGCCVIQ